MRAQWYTRGQRDAVAAFTKVAVGQRQARRISEALDKYRRRFLGFKTNPALRESEEYKNIDNQAGLGKLIHRLTNPFGAFLSDPESIKFISTDTRLLSPGVSTENMSPRMAEALRKQVHATALSGRHTAKTPVSVTPTPRGLSEEEATSFLSSQKGTRPHDVVYRGDAYAPPASKRFFPREFRPDETRWLSGSPSVAAGYGPRIKAYRLPNDPEIGPFTPHIAKDPRKLETPVDKIDRYKGQNTSNQGAWPYYERVVPNRLLEPSQIAEYKRLPMSENEYQLVRGKENPIALPPKLTP